MKRVVSLLIDGLPAEGLITDGRSAEGCREVWVFLPPPTDRKGRPAPAARYDIPTRVLAHGGTFETSTTKIQVTKGTKNGNP